MNIFKAAIKYFSILIFLLSASASVAQGNRVSYNPCFLKDSIGSQMAFIRLNAARIFIDTADCKDVLLDSIAVRYTRTKEVRYLVALSTIRQNAFAKTDGLFTDAIKLIADADFAGFIDELYMAKGRFLPLQDELIAAMNMILNGRPLKQKYMGQLNIEIQRAKDSADKNRETYLEKLKQKIDAEQYR